MHQIHRRFEQAGKQEKSELEDRLIEIIQADKQEKKNTKKSTKTELTSSAILQNVRPIY